MLVGQGDIRHILRTVATATRVSTPPKIHFWIYEDTPELIAKQILLLTLVLEPAAKIGPREKTEMFLELHSNAHIRSKTNDYLTAKAKELTELITDPERMKVDLPLIDVSALKHRERDEIEDVFRFWRKSTVCDRNLK